MLRVRDPRVRWWLGEAGVIYLVTLAFLVWSPSQDVPGGPVLDVQQLLAAVGWDVPFVWLERGLNVVLFLPFGFLGALLWWRRSVAFWGGCSLVLSALIETVQLLVLTDRVPTMSDVAANTWGGLSGAGLVWAGAKCRFFDTSN